jgi:hypothetical protein
MPACPFNARSCSRPRRAGDPRPKESYHDAFVCTMPTSTCKARRRDRRREDCGFARIRYKYTSLRGYPCVFPQQGADITITTITMHALIQRRRFACLLYAAGRWRAAAKLGARFVDARLQLRRTEARGARTVGYSWRAWREAGGFLGGRCGRSSFSIRGAAVCVELGWVYLGERVG